MHNASKYDSNLEYFQHFTLKYIAATIMTQVIRGNLYDVVYLSLWCQPQDAHEDQEETKQNKTKRKDAKGGSCSQQLSRG